MQRNFSCISLTATQDTQLSSWLSISTLFINFIWINLYIVLLRPEKRTALFWLWALALHNHLHIPVCVCVCVCVCEWVCLPCHQKPRQPASAALWWNLWRRRTRRRWLSSDQWWLNEKTNQPYQPDSITTDIQLKLQQYCCALDPTESLCVCVLTVPVNKWEQVFLSLTACS